MFRKLATVIAMTVLLAIGGLGMTSAISTKAFCSVETDGCSNQLAHVLRENITNPFNAQFAKAYVWLDPHSANAIYKAVHRRKIVQRCETAYGLNSSEFIHCMAGADGTPETAATDDNPDTADETTSLTHEERVGKAKRNLMIAMMLVDMTRAELNQLEPLAPLSETADRSESLIDLMKKDAR